MTADEKFFAWLDGELGPVEAADMEAKVAADPELARLAQNHRALGAQLRGAFNPVAAAPVPEDLQTAIHPSAELIDFAGTKRAWNLPSLPQWTALAATLIIGVLLGTMVPQRNNAPVDVQRGKIVATAGLNQALDTQLASAPAGEVRIGLTFRDHTGEICRTFTQQTSSGLACRNGGRWQLKGLFAAPTGQETDYRMAASIDPNLATLVDATMAGQPFDAAEEKASRAEGWR